MSLPRMKSIIQILGKRNIHSSRCTFLFYEHPDKDGFYKKSKEEKEWEKLPRKEKIRIEWNLFKASMKEYFQNVTEDFKRGPRLYVPEHEVDVIRRFTGNPSDLKDWVVSTDSDHNIGFSTAQ